MSLAVFAAMYAGCGALMGAATIAAKIENDRTAHEDDLAASKLPHAWIEHPGQKPSIGQSVIAVIPEAVHNALCWPAYVPFILNLIID